MRLDLNSTIVGRPALEIRSFLRHIQGRMVRERTFQERFEMSPSEADRMICELEKAELIASEDPGCRVGEGVRYWTTTIKGNAFAMASSARPIKRATAHKAVVGLLERTMAVNARSDLACVVERITVFGSYLSDNDRINDVDLLLDLAQRFPEDAKKQGTLRNGSFARACESGRKLDFMEQLYWPLMEVQLILKNRSRALSLHYEDHQLVESVPHRIIFENGAIKNFS